MLLVGLHLNLNNGKIKTSLRMEFNFGLKSHNFHRILSSFYSKTEIYFIIIEYNRIFLGNSTEAQMGSSGMKSFLVTYILKNLKN